MMNSISKIQKDKGSIPLENKNIGIWAFAGFCVVSFLGTLLHFLYEWTGESVAIAWLSAVNESTWEHMKLLFFPMFLVAIVQYFVDGKNIDGYWSVKLCSILIGLTLIPVLFYTLQGIFGKTPDWVNITTFFISAFIAYYYEYRAFKSGNAYRYSRLSLLLICIIAVLFIAFTFITPKIPLFKDPMNGMYGVMSQ